MSRSPIKLLTLLFCLFFTVSCGHKPAPEPTPNAEVPVKPEPRADVRGVWLATVTNLDWPSRASWAVTPDAQRIAMQQQDLTDRLDALVRIGVNTVFFQVKPDGSALYRSRILPWSDVLTGTLGQDPGYDPLAFMLTEAHKRGLKVHAWLNPYRVSMDTQPATAALLTSTLKTPPASVYALHKAWIRTASDRFVLDPGVPEVRKWVTSIVAELVTHYDVDGIQFDDYFYYETPASKLDDQATYQKYGQDFPNKGDWRRHNTLLLIREIATTIRSLKPGIEFGISPAGVWRNIADDPQGSDTQSGIPAYDSAYADTRLWVEEGLLDYIVPQIYWPHARKIVRYDTLVRWWADVVRPTRTRLYIGIALYKVGAPSKTEPDWTVAGGVPELKRQLDLNDALPEVTGTVLFRESFLHQPQTAEAAEYLRSRWNP